jgi:hypothetical protein
MPDRGSHDAAGSRKCAIPLRATVCG